MSAAEIAQLVWAGIQNIVTLLAGAATVVVAFLSHRMLEQIRLQRLALAAQHDALEIEMERENARQATIAARIVRATKSLDASAYALEMVVADDQPYAGALEGMLEHVEEARAIIKDLLNDAGSCRMEVMAHLDLAVVQLYLCVNPLQRSIARPSGIKSGEIQKLIQDVRRVVSRLDIAHGLLPAGQRRWGGGVKDYEDVLSDAAEIPLPQKLAGQLEREAT